MAHTRLVPVVAALVVLSAALAGIAPAAADAQVSASVGEYSVVRGDSVSMSVQHSAPANLTIVGGGFEAVVELGGSGSDSVELDTYGSTGTASEFISGGSAEILGPPLNDALKPGKYRLEVTIDGEPEAFGSLTVRPNGAVTSETGVLPGDYFEEDGGGALSAIQTHDGIGRNNHNVVSGDHAAFVVNENGSRIGAPFDGDASMTDLSGEGFEMAVTELDPEPNTDRKVYSGESLTVHGQLGGENGQFGVFWDTDGVDIGTGSNHTYEFQLTVDAEKNPLYEENETLATERVTLVEPSVTIDADPGFTLTPWDGNQLRINGQTNLLPGTELRVRALQEPPEALLWQNDVTVSTNGTFETTLDFSRADRPSNVPVQIREYDETKHTVRLTAANASLLFPSQEVRDDSVSVERVTLTQGGFLLLAANGTSIGTTNYVGSRTNETVSVPLNESLDGPTNVTATAVVDANENSELDDSDPAYGSWGTLVEETAVIRPAEQNDSDATENTTTANSTTVANGTATANSTTAPNETAGTTAQTIQVNDADPIAPAASNDAGSSSGFVPLSPVTTLVALCAAALLAIRRGPDRL